MLISVSVLRITQIKSNLKQMKKSFNLIITLGLIFITWSLQAQYDDVYYGSTPARSRTRAVSNSDSYQSDRNTDYNESDNPDYDDQSYNYMDDYDYTYTHQIRRFSRPLIGRGFYDPYYMDPWNYDPYYYSSGNGFITPGIGLGFYTFNDYSRWNRWYRFNSFRYWDPWTYSYWSYDPFLFNRFNNFYWASNSWCPGSWYGSGLYGGLYGGNYSGYYGGGSYWSNGYNGVYKPQYYSNSNIHYGARTYGATNSGDHGPVRTSSRIFSEPNGSSNPGQRFSPRDHGTTVVRERDVPINRNGGFSTPGSDGATSDRLSPRADRSTVRERTNGTSTDRTFRDYNNGNDQQSNRPSPRQEYTPRDYSPRQQASPRFESPRQETPRFESPRQETPRFESPRVNTPSPRSNNFDQSYRTFTPKRESSSERSFSQPSYSSPRSNGGYNSGGSASHSYSGSTSGGGSVSSVRSSPRSH